VLLPSWVLALPRAQRRYVVRHEEEHRRAYDASLLCLASLTLILAPWNVALWWQLRRLHLAIEMACDNRVVAALGDAPAYGALLLKVAQAASRGPRIQPAFLGGVGMLEHRLTVLLQPTPLRHAQRFLVPAIACGLVILALTMPHPLIGSRSIAHGAMSSSASGQGSVTATTRATVPDPSPTGELR
jgi:beta-lactamase regulating signal transducer with metallopeptidase domain